MLIFFVLYMIILIDCKSIILTDDYIIFEVNNSQLSSSSVPTVSDFWFISEEGNKQLTESSSFSTSSDPGFILSEEDKELSTENSSIHTGSDPGFPTSVDDKQLSSEISLVPAMSESGVEEFNQWVSATEGQPILLKCIGDDQNRIMWVTPSYGIFNSGNHSFESQQLQTNDHPHIEILHSGNLLINDFRRDDAGRYRCFTFNNSEYIYQVINLGIDDAGFQKLYTHSLYIGAFAAGLFLAIVLLLQAFCFLMNRFGCKCCWGTYISSKAEKVLRVIRSIEQYKTQQLERLNQNYNSQVSNINETFSRQMEQLQESYKSQKQSLKNLGQYSNHQLQQLKDQYNEQCSRVGEYSMRQLNKVHSNYMEQQDRICRYTSKQLQQLTQSYKHQQKSFNKIIDNIPDFNKKSSFYPDPYTLEMKNTSKSTSINIERNLMTDMLPDICNKTLNNSKIIKNHKSFQNGIGSPNTILNKIPVYEAVSSHFNIFLERPLPKSPCPQSDVLFTLSSKSDMILPGLTKEDKYNVGDKNGRRDELVMKSHRRIFREDKYNVGNKNGRMETSVMQPHRMVTLDHLS